MKEVILMHEEEPRIHAGTFLAICAVKGNVHEMGMDIVRVLQEQNVRKGLYATRVAV